MKLPLLNICSSYTSCAYPAVQLAVHSYMLEVMPCGVTSRRVCSCSTQPRGINSLSSPTSGTARNSSKESQNPHIITFCLFHCCSVPQHRGSFWTSVPPVILNVPWQIECKKQAAGVSIVLYHGKLGLRFTSWPQHMLQEQMSGHVCFWPAGPLT